MSASLVGSEMCIRDRHATSAIRICLKGALLGTCGTARKSSLTAPSALPVSYTHLTLPTICSV
eukprot:10816947-Alexandrium_andersonii.AAC.1